MLKRDRVRFASAACLLALALGCDDASSSDPATDAGATSPDGSSTPVDSGTQPEPEASPRVLRLSATGTDALYSVVYDSAGHAYAAGFVADGIEATSDRAMVVVKLLPTGELDPAFGSGGIARHNVTIGGTNGELARSLVLQSNGKIVLGGVIEHDVSATGTAASDRDLALVRLNPDGSLDTGFGTGGVVRLDLNTGLETTNASGTATLSGADTLWNVALAANDAIVVHGAQRAEGYQADGVSPRTDTDFVLVRLAADGAPDTSFGTSGKFLLDLEQANASARAALVLGDGSIVAGGYANTSGLGSVQPVLYKVTSAGVLDATFATGGVFHQIVLTAATEAYGAVLQGTKLVTAGYGRSSTSESLDWVSLRLTSKGVLDTTWGINGVARVDAAGFNDNARNVTVLPDARVALVGGVQLVSGNADAAVGILTANGMPDYGFAPYGHRSYDLGGTADFFWGGAVSPDGKTLALVGLKGMGNAATAESNDDAAVFFLPLDD